MIARRFVPLVVAFALVFAPVALEACQVTCLTAGGTAAVMPAGHVHHHGMASTPVPPSGAPASTLSRTCDHGSDVPAIARAANCVVLAPAITAATLVIPDVHPRLERLHHSIASSSERIPLTTQLRV